MAWITSATNGRAMGGARSLQVALLVVHLILLATMLHDRSASDTRRSTDHAVAAVAPELTTAPGAAASLALLSGLALLVLLMVAGRARTPALPVASEGAEPPAGESTSIRRRPTVATEAHAGLIARLNHDLRTPLNAIIGFADLMRAETFGPLGNERYRAYAAHMQSCGLDLLRATESTLTMASLLTGPRGGGRETVALAAVVQEAWPLAAGPHAGNLAMCTLDLAIDPALEVRGDRMALRESLVNLLGNARLRAAAGGRIGVGATSSYGRVDAWIEVQAGSAGAHRTGCRASGAGDAVDELAIGLSRTLLELHGMKLEETCNRPDRWAVALILEDAAQPDLFGVAEETARPARSNGRATNTLTDYLAGASPSRSA